MSKYFFAAVLDLRRRQIVLTISSYGAEQPGNVLAGLIARHDVADPVAVLLDLHLARADDLLLHFVDVGLRAGPAS